MPENSVLDRINLTLQRLVDESNGDMEAVFYGFSRKHKNDNTEMKTWNMFIFRREEMSGVAKRNEPRQTYYKLHIIHEDFIPEGFVEKVINALESNEGIEGTKLKVSDTKIPYDYAYKSNTDQIVEMATITFTHPERRY